MPQKNNNFYCVNHPDEILLPNEGFNALTKVTKENENIVFKISSGIPVQAYICRICGYIEIYYAREFNSKIFK